MDVKRIGVVGAGTMGRGIAQVCAASGFDVVMCDVSAEAVASGFASIEKQLARAVEKEQKERMSAAEKDALLSRIETVTGIEAMAGVDVCIEAATETPDVKLDLFRALESVCREDAILASKTRPTRMCVPTASARRPHTPRRFAVGGRILLAVGFQDKYADLSQTSEARTGHARRPLHQ